MTNTSNAQRIFNDARQILATLKQLKFTSTRRRGGYWMWFLQRDKSVFTLSYNPTTKSWKVSPNDDSPSYWEVIQVLLKRGSAR